MEVRGCKAYRRGVWEFDVVRGRHLRRHERSLFGDVEPLHELVRQVPSSVTA
jgi:hypothetical protein